MTGFRVEHDSMGEVSVPADALWGAQTERARAHFVSGEPMPRAVITALAQVKAAAAEVNAELGVIEPDLARAISAGARSPEATTPATSRSMCSRPARAPRPT